MSVAESDRRLIANGCEPVACIGKAPKGNGWQQRPNTIEAVTAERYALGLSATNTGLRTDRLPTIDIDTAPAPESEIPAGYVGDNPDHTKEIARLAYRVLGDNELFRVGKKGGAIPYRMSTPIGKIVIKADHRVFGHFSASRGNDYYPGSSVVKPTRWVPWKIAVEILGRGQQFVAYGIHPDTGKPYRWPNTVADVIEAEPLLVPYAELPEVTPEQLRDFARQCAELLTRLGYENVRVTNTGEHAGAWQAKRLADKYPVPLDYLRRMVATIDMTQFDGNRTGWIGFLGGLRATPLRDVEGIEADRTLCEIADEASQRGASYEGRADVEFNFYSLTAEGGTTFGSLYHLAKQNGWDEPPPQPTMGERFTGNAEEIAKRKAEQDAKRRAKYVFRTAEEDYTAKPITYWDEFNALPRIEGGCAVIAYGPMSSHKTGVVLKFCLDAIEKGAKVLYLAPEGAHGIKRQRLPTAIAQRGKQLRDLAGRWHLFPTTPGLMEDGEIAELIAACKEQQFTPDIVVIDTLTRAARNVDISAPHAGVGLVTGMEKLAEGFGGAAVIAITHPGKDASKGSIGSSLVESLAYAIWKISFDKPRETVTLWVEKMKDGEADFGLEFKVTTNAVPVVTGGTRTDRKPGRGPGRPKVTAAQAEHGKHVAWVVEQLRLLKPGEYLNTATLASRVQQGKREDESEQDHIDRKAFFTRTLTNAAKLPSNPLGEFIVRDNADQPVLAGKSYRWRLPDGYPAGVS